MKKLLLASMSVLMLVSLFSPVSVARDLPAGVEMNVSITVLNYSEVVKTLPPMIPSKDKIMVNKSMMMAMSPKNHFEAVKLANNYLNEALGSSFVSKHFECVGIEENVFIPSTRFVIYKYRSNGYEMNMSMPVVLAMPVEMGIPQGYMNMITTPQEIKLSAEDAEAIASEKGLELPMAGELLIKERTHRIAWVVTTQKTPTDMETTAYYIDAENGDILGEGKYIPRPPIPEKVRNKTQTHRPEFIPYSEIMRNETTRTARQTVIPPRIPPIETTAKKKNNTASEKPPSIPHTGMKTNLTIATALALNASTQQDIITSGCIIFEEDFEGIFPGDNWLVCDSNPGSGEDYWGDSYYTSYGGSWSGYCADIGDTGANHEYDNNMDAYMVRKYSIDASDWNSAVLSYYSWYKTQEDYDYLQVIVTGDGGDTWYGIGDSFNGNSDWDYHSVRVPSEYLTSQFNIGFIFYSDSSITYEGAYIDDIKLVSDIYISSVNWYTDIFMNEERETTTQSIKIYSYNGDSSTHKLYTKLNVTHASGQTHSFESSHVDVPPGYILNTTFYFSFTDAYIEKATFDIELWEDKTWPLSDIMQDRQADDEIQKFYIVFEWPDGVSDDYRCEDTWHHPWHPVITHTAVDNATYATSHYLAINYLMDFIDDHMTYNSSDPWGDRSSDLEILDDKKGDCNDYADLYIGLARSLNIPSRVVLGFTYGKEDPDYCGTPSNFCGAFCRDAIRFWMHAWVESYYNSDYFGIDFHHVDPRASLLEDPGWYKSSNTTCISHIQASAYTGCSDDYGGGCDWAYDEITCSNGFIDVTTSTDGGYDSVYHCPSDIDADGICDNFDSDRDGDDIENGVDDTPCGVPRGWRDFTPSDWVDDQTPDCTIEVRDMGSGLDVSTAYYKYSRNGGYTWYGWFSADCTGIDGTADYQTITAESVPFHQDSSTHNEIKFKIANMDGNTDESPSYIVKIDHANPPEPTTSSSTHPDEDEWYDDDPSFVWDTPSDPSGIDGYSYVLDDSGSTTPDETIDTIENSRSYTDIGDDVWYFHVRAKDNAGNWGGADHCRVKIGSGEASTTDACIALAIAAGSREYDSRWDVSGDGQVTSLDALMVLQAGWAG